MIMFFQALTFPGFVLPGSQGLTLGILETKLNSIPCEIMVLKIRLLKVQER